ncbi:MAG: Ig-like domain-containing protein, partial [bacterium]
MRRLARGPAALTCLVATGLVLLGPGCAKRGLPPGGPEDKTAPRVESMSPPSGTVEVDPAERMRLVFSEPMKRRTVETAVIVSPPVKWIKRYWEENTYVMVPGQSLLAEATYLVSVANTAEDRHGVKMEKTFVAGFSTGSTIEAGVISGAVSWKNLTVERGVVEV